MRLLPGTPGPTPPLVRVFLPVAWDPVRVDPALSRPRLLVVVIALVGLEAALLLAVAVIYVARAVTVSGEPGVAFVTAALAAVIGGFLVFACRGLWRGRRWARAPVVTWQLLQLAVTAPVVTGPLWWGGASLVAASVVVLVALFSPAVVRATASTADPPVT